MSGTKKRLLFIGESVTLAHVARPYVLASGIDHQLYDVHFAADKHYSFLFTDSALTHWPIFSQPPARFEKILKNGDVLYNETTLAHYVADEISLLKELQPDAVIGDMRLSLNVSTKLLNIPHIALSNAIWSPFAVDLTLPLPSFLPFRAAALLKEMTFKEIILEKAFNFLLKPTVFYQQAKGLNALRKRYGLLPFSSYLEGFINGDVTLFLDTPIVAPVTQLLTRQHYIGPLCWEPDMSLPKWWKDIVNSKPIALVSLGSSGNLKILHQLLSVIQSMGFSVVVATAGRVGRDSLPKGVYAEDFLPTGKIAKKAAVVVCNGGSPSSYQALREGVPVLGMSSNMDQLLAMRAIEKAGGGIMLRAESANKDNIYRTVDELCNNPRYRWGASKIAKEFKNYDAIQRVETILSQLLKPINVNKENTARREVVSNV